MIKIPVKGDIIDNDTAEFYDFWGMSNYCSPNQVESALQNANHQPVTVEIASNGGDVFAGSEIYSLLKDYDNDVTVNIVGLAASAASVIAMAGDIVKIAPTAQIMIHKAWTDSQGNADDLEHQANVLGTIDQSIASAYEKKTGMSQDELLQMMSNETWLTAKDAVDKGFADEIMFEDEQTPVFNSTEKPVVSKATLNKFRNMQMKMAEKNKKSDSAILLNKKLEILRGEN
ncbi:head maturation protease, ClpP-related [Ligilactobacillus sp. 110_WCHN]|uniref:head maturation protease, ClpP-related n=1 Tax=Ligilactobacillus sp. 110_WCHN TaxID=3057125 RepID=UPI002673A062|nr:head maturation protease, ClpP-related [Ligilactobacillus sp. 110_WCHN]MDO3394017.1 Clp protease ClpP [Ligilactobacillus sp. 110_WCHN]